jgi:hypothetical protein
LKIHRALFAVVFLVGIVAAAQTPTPAVLPRQIELQKEAQAQAFTILGFPMMNPGRPVPILWPPLKKMENK